MSYCQFCLKESTKEVHKIYHDQQYGFPIEDDNELFGRFILEINQAGLSWETILKKQENFKKAFVGFDIEKIARFNEKDFERLMNDKGIIRNKLKINAVIYNANKIMQFKQEFGTFKLWLDYQHPLSHLEWTKLFKKSFKFVGEEIVKEFLMSTGYLSGAHDDDCTVQIKIKSLQPKWMEI